jgi:hypothetical protein
MDTAALSNFLSAGLGSVSWTLHKNNGSSYSLEIIQRVECSVGVNFHVALNGYNPRIIYQIWQGVDGNTSWSIFSEDHEGCEDYDFLQELLYDFFPEESEMDIKPEEG